MGLSMLGPIEQHLMHEQWTKEGIESTSSCPVWLTKKKEKEKHHSPELQGLTL
jgi:hypothetical protein